MKSVTLIVILIVFASAEQPPCPVDEVPACVVRCNGLIGRPICAVPDRRTGNSYTFASTCEMNINNCNCPSYPYLYSYDGPCKPDCSDKIICPRAYKPICALPIGFLADPKTFLNICSLSVNNCNEVQQYKYKHVGKCSPEEIQSPMRVRVDD